MQEKHTKIDKKITKDWTIN